MCGGIGWHKDRDMKPNDKLRGLNKDDGLGRIEYCRAMLSLRGFLTDSETVKVKHRIKQWCKRHGYHLVSGSIMEPINND